MKVIFLYYRLHILYNAYNNGNQPMNQYIYIYIYHRFLRPHEYREKPRIALVSYPRSGNSMARSMLETMTSIVTGTDSRPDRTLSRSLLERGLIGEGITDERVHIVKSHFPERYGYKKFQAHKIIMLTRNPFDAIDSYFNMAFTNTHTKSLGEENYETFADIWNALVLNEIKVWNDFHAYWLSKKYPILVLRYEDFLTNPLEIMKRIIRYVLTLSFIESFLSFFPFCW